MIIFNFNNTNFSAKDVKCIRKNLGRFLLFYLIANISMALIGLGFNSFNGMLHSVIMILILCLGLFYLYLFLKGCLTTKLINIKPVSLLILGAFVISVTNIIFASLVFPTIPDEEFFGYTRTFNPFIAFGIIAILIAYCVIFNILISKKLKTIEATVPSDSNLSTISDKNHYIDPTLQSYTDKQLKSLNWIGWLLIFGPEILAIICAGLITGLDLSNKMGDGYIFIDLIPVIALFALLVVFIVFNIKQRILKIGYVLTIVIGFFVLRVISFVSTTLINVYLIGENLALLRTGLLIVKSFVLAFVLLAFYFSLGKTLLVNKQKEKII